MRQHWTRESRGGQSGRSSRPKRQRSRGCRAVLPRLASRPLRPVRIARPASSNSSLYPCRLARPCSWTRSIQLESVLGQRRAARRRRRGFRQSRPPGLQDSPDSVSDCRARNFPHAQTLTSTRRVTRQPSLRRTLHRRDRHLRFRSAGAPRVRRQSQEETRATSMSATKTAEMSESIP